MKRLKKSIKWLKENEVLVTLTGIFKLVAAILQVTNYL